MSTMALRGMIHLSERARMYVFAAPSCAANSSASTAEAPPPMTMTVFPLADFPVRSEEW